MPRGTVVPGWPPLSSLLAGRWALSLPPSLHSPHSCDCTNFLLQECNKQGLLSEANFANLMAKW